MPKVTISTIADAAGVSKATVSRYLNGHFERMSSETKQKLPRSSSNSIIILIAKPAR
ncbi:LacI family DNA-binding transcriptional regulator [Lacticaseibacillus saniviri]|uniref:LacI family DNA-binding transcriptional regulator n=1 Tax=Lacticaseibacillus saniviri TaxID=931533 RepID=UPI0009E8849A|nr:LacI family DNA-binding transcriptional regulator [Lacticaseibacillus saniviri]